MVNRSLKQKKATKKSEMRCNTPKKSTRAGKKKMVKACVK